MLLKISDIDMLSRFVHSYFEANNVRTVVYKLKKL